MQVIFDMDGVLFDSERTLLQCWLDTAAGYGLDGELVQSTYLQCIGRNRRQTREICQNAFLDILGEEKLWRMWEESAALHQKRYADGGLPLKAGVREILAFLKRSGIPAGIASSTEKRTVEARLRAAGLADSFVGCIGGDAVTVSKPAPEIYLLACEAFGFRPESTFAIEDSYNGIRAAHAAGLRPLMVPDLVAADEEMRGLSEAVCADLFEVMDYLKRTGG